MSRLVFNPFAAEFQKNFPRAIMRIPPSTERAAGGPVIDKYEVLTRMQMASTRETAKPVAQPPQEVRGNIHSFLTPTKNQTREKRKSIKSYAGPRAKGGKSHFRPFPKFDANPTPIKKDVKRVDARNLSKARFYQIVAGADILVFCGDSWIAGKQEKSVAAFGQAGRDNRHFFVIDGVQISVRSSDVRKANQHQRVSGNERPKKKFRPKPSHEPSPQMEIPQASNKEWYYGVYLKSDLWHRIRARVFVRDNGRCRMCGQQAEVVHHRSYGRDVLLGKCDNQLSALCNPCHEDVHFDEEGRKLLLWEVDKIFLEHSQLLAKAKGSLPG